MTTRRTPPATSLQTPTGWELPPLGGWLATTAAAVASVVVAVPAVLLAAQGDGRGAAPLGAVALVLLVSAVLARPKTRREPPRPVTVEVDGVHAGGVRFPVRPTSPVASVAFVVAGLAFVALAVAAAVVAVAQGEWPMLFGFFLLTAIGAVFLLGGVAGLRGARSGLGVDLTPHHVTLSLGFDRMVLAWDDIDGIEAMSIRYGFRVIVPAPVQHWLLITAKRPDEIAARRPGGRSMLGRVAGRVAGNVVAGVPTTRLAGDPVLLFHALRHYLDTPAGRAELGGGVVTPGPGSGMPGPDAG